MEQRPHAHVDDANVDESDSMDEDLLKGPDALSAGDWKPPKLLNREVVASGKDSQAFGFHLESRAWRLNFPSASRQAFVAEDSSDSVTRCRTYLSNNASHMNYPLYRQQGLPITSSHMESMIKPINRRIKGTEKFWLVETSECVLQLRADYLSQSQPMINFWKRWQAGHNGSNAYKTAC